MARMRFEIVLAPEAVEDLKGLKAKLRSERRQAAGASSDFAVSADQSSGFA